MHDGGCPPIAIALSDSVDLKIVLTLALGCFKTSLKMYLWIMYVNKNFQSLNHFIDNRNKQKLNK